MKVGFDRRADSQFEDLPADMAEQNELDRLGLNDSRNHLRIVSDLIALDPVLMKNREHLTPEENTLSESYSKILQKRRQGIQQRLDFFEIQRNRDLFNADSYEALLAECLAKSSSEDVPPEFQEWVAYYEKYQKENPGKFYMALSYGPTMQGVKPGQWMSASDYKKLFDDNGQLPKELRKAIDQYTERIQGEMAERSNKVSGLAEHLYNLKTSKNKGMERE